MHEAQLREQRRRTSAVIDAVVSKMLSERLIVNHLRGCVAEAIVGNALGPEWTWCSEDWGAWDFARADGIKLEVKQSAALQTWSAPDAKPSRPSFDIGARQGRFTEHAAWIGGNRRWADLYVFAHHPIVDATADHRDPEQWKFYVVLATALPTQGSIGLGGIRMLSPCYDICSLPAAVAQLALTVDR